MGKTFGERFLPGDEHCEQPTRRGKKVGPGFTFTDATTPARFSGNTIKAATALGMVRMSIEDTSSIEAQLRLWLPQHLLPLFNPYMGTFWWFISTKSLESAVDTTMSKLKDPKCEQSRHRKIMAIVDLTQKARKVLEDAIGGTN